MPGGPERTAPSQSPRTARADHEPAGGTRKALAARDITTVYQILYHGGVSQREIARRTGQSQSEVSEIIHGSRQVRDVTVLERIADGLGVPPVPRRNAGPNRRSLYRILASSTDPTGDPARSTTMRALDNDSAPYFIVIVIFAVILVVALAIINS